MDETGDDSPASSSGYITPPLSPTKSISTQGWSSPRTPTSPRKSHSCVFFRDIDSDPFSSPQASPTKRSFAPRLRALQLSDGPIADQKPVQSACWLSLGRGLHHPDSSFLPHSTSTTRLESPLLQGQNCERSLNTSSVPSSPETHPKSRASSRDYTSPSPIPRSQRRSQSLTTVSPRSSSPVLCAQFPPPAHDSSTPMLRRISPRHSSSPLRPSQWVTRGGLLSAAKSSSQTPDRFISSRRPPNTTRDSFELAKAAERVTAQDRSARGTSPHIDPFSRRLQRSGRLNNELRNLRETHSILNGRATLNRRGGNISLRRNSFSSGARQISAGAVWNVGGSSAVSDTVVGVSNGRGGMLGSGTNAPLYTSMFLSRSDPEAEREAYEKRLALAFDIDRASRVLEHTTPPTSPVTSTPNHAEPHADPQTKHPTGSPNRCHENQYQSYLLDAPQLRDDYYCSLLAYSHTSKYLAVGLGNYVHLWSEQKGVDTPESLNTLSTTSSSDVQHITSLGFSSTQGGQAILAVGRADGRIALWSHFDQEPRFDATQPKPISCVSFRPTTVKRPSLRDKAMTVPTEELLVGDEAGHIYFYSVEWPNETESALFGWHGAMTLLARLNIHTQQICGLSWSIDGELFASGGNDNACYLFETKKILQRPTGTDSPTATLDVRYGPNGESIWTVTPGRGPVLTIEQGREKHRWELNAAVKAIAFCPWQRGLIAIGGGSNDRCIHFYHTVSGACLATIDCAGQVTSLIWSTTRREIAATFGFAQPEHPFRVAVFAWPSCEQIVAIPWYDENRALFAIAYPGPPNSAGERGQSGASEGCIVVAASDAAIRFHEIWTDDKKGLGGDGVGLLGGSEILENLHGIERDGDLVIR
ncbi:WD40 repeat-like protein [Amniculicola lignicola CBS 123094]|uniref:WD40 repeat-like protein n=1 Tax=Amniculicola lignicola CBS 123094 TaxID=1392246 RepID=A0A6A5WE98_9PLEO|nr:WD40 repeat-like protein [Amniculicola lignicola CBS 123094]